jgi:hypothetical protein
MASFSQERSLHWISADRFLCQIPGLFSRWGSPESLFCSPDWPWLVSRRGQQRVSPSRRGAVSAAVLVMIEGLADMPISALIFLVRLRPSAAVNAVDKNATARRGITRVAERIFRTGWISAGIATKNADTTVISGILHGSLKYAACSGGVVHGSVGENQPRIVGYMGGNPYGQLTRCFRTVWNGQAPEITAFGDLETISRHCVAQLTVELQADRIREQSAERASFSFNDNVGVPPRAPLPPYCDAILSWRNLREIQFYHQYSQSILNLSIS